MPDQSKIEQAKARLQKIVDDVGEIGWVDAGDVAAIRTVLAELERLQQATAAVVAELRDDPAQWSHDLADKLEGN